MDELEKMPKKVRKIFDLYYAETYQACKITLAECEKIGYTFEYGLDAMPYEFKKL